MKKLKKRVVEDKNALISIHFSKLKNLKDLTIGFGKPPTAIMGINGCGKTTVLHALTCTFKPEKDGEYYRFSQFFPPNPVMS